MIFYCFFCPVKVFGDEYMHEPGGSINLSPGNKNSACLLGKSWAQFHTFTYITLKSYATLFYCFI